MSRGLEAHLVVSRGEAFGLDLQLSIPNGRTVALLGPNGAGKSTAVSALAGLLPLDSGRIELSGRVLDDPLNHILVPPEERRVALVFQDHLLFPHLSALENVAFGPRSRGVHRHEARLKAKAWIERVGLAGRESLEPREFSGGEAQRIAVARALASEPELLLLDEPLSALDVTARSEFRQLLFEHLKEFEGPRLLITHDPAEAFHLADEIHVIEGGRVTQVGGADDIRLRPRTAYAADLAGSNLFTGTATDGAVEVGDLRLAIADRDARGAVRISIRPSAVSVHRERPGGSPRNRWLSVVDRIEDHGSRVRILSGAPLKLMIEVTPGARQELGLDSGAKVWLSVKATDIGVEPHDEEGP